MGYFLHHWPFVRPIGLLIIITLINGRRRLVLAQRNVIDTTSPSQIVRRIVVLLHLGAHEVVEINIAASFSEKVVIYLLILIFLLIILWELVTTLLSITKTPFSLLSTTLCTLHNPARQTSKFILAALSLPTDLRRRPFLRHVEFLKVHLFHNIRIPRILRSFT